MDIIRELDLIFFVAMINVELFIAIVTNYRLKISKNNDIVLYSNIKSWVKFYYCLAIANILGILSRNYLFEYDDLKSFTDALSIAFNYVAITMKVFHIEKVLKPFKRKYFTIFNVLVIFSTVATWNWIKDSLLVMILQIIIQMVGFSLLPLMYLKVGIGSQGVIRRNALFVVIGIILLEIALTTQAHNIELIFPGFTIDFFTRFGFPFQVINPSVVIFCIFLIYKSYSEDL